jgi:hypothetical protein
MFRFTINDTWIHALLVIVAPDIAAALKKIKDCGKRTDIWHLVL